MNTFTSRTIIGFNKYIVVGNFDGSLVAYKNEIYQIFKSLITPSNQAFLIRIL